MHSNNLLEHVYLCLRKYLWVWLVPMILGLVLSGIYNKLLATKTYTARQSLILRDDLLGDAYKPSRFESQESLKSAQETILEIARKPQVVKAVLNQLGPASSFSFASEYPSIETIEDVQGNITLAAPNGAEFGKTEAVVLSVKTVDAERSRKFVNLLLDEIDAKLSEVRLLRLGSMRSELEQAGENALISLNDSSQRLQELEKSFGAEITTIRALNDPQSGGGFDLKLNQIRLEHRQAEAQLSSAMMQRELLQQAQQSGGVEFVTSNELLQLQPALQGIMTNLSTAMAQLAIDEGRYTSLHPQLRRSQRAVERQQQQLFDSLGTTVKGLDSQIETLSTLKRRLGDSIFELESRLESLTEQRVPYATLEEEVKKKTEVYNDVQGQLAQIQSYASSTDDVAMLTRVDDPQVSSRPDQIGASKAGLVGAALGLMLGLGLVALMAPPFVDPRTASYPPNNPDYADRIIGGARGPAPASSPQVQPDAPAETHAESRLKSVTAMQQRPAAGALSSKLAENSGVNEVAEQSASSVDPADPIAKHLVEMKQRYEAGPSNVGNQSTQTAPNSPPAKAAPTSAVPATVAEATKPSSDAVAEKPAQTSQPISENRPKDGSDVSSEDVIAELKKLQGKGGQKLASEAGKPDVAKAAAEKTGKPQADVEDDVVVQRRPALSSFLRNKDDLSKTAGAANTNPKPADSAGKPEVVTVDRMRTPQVPDSITKGRITAESLLESANKNKGAQDENKRAAVDSSLKEKIASLANEPAQTPAPTGGIEKAGDENIESRIPSITDYTRSLDRKLGSTEGDRIADSINNIVPNSGAGKTASGGQKSNVRPVDIARSLDDPTLQRTAVDNVQPDENRADAVKPQRRSKSISDYVGAMDNSVAGLVRRTKGTDVDQAAVRAGEESVAPGEKVAAVKPAAEPAPRDESASSSIPTQIRELSDSFSSFARPSESQ